MRRRDSLRRNGAHPRLYHRERPRRHRSASSFPKGGGIYARGGTRISAGASTIEDSLFLHNSGMPSELELGNGGAGRHVQALWNGWVRESPVALMWDGRTSTGHRAAPGLYFVKMTRPRAVERRLHLID
ncbi:MAG: hypothetical protein GF355_05050 [Candidatus Eisenbacteria bacterium]|nr:hypothetical protein [Candidatus Eisenbacteria bacterium]